MDISIHLESPWSAYQLMKLTNHDSAALGKSVATGKFPSIWMSSIGNDIEVNPAEQNFARQIGTWLFRWLA
jgi:hypothetical protein